MAVAARTRRPPCGWRTRCGQSLIRRERLCAFARELGADVPCFLEDGPQLGTRRRRRRSSRSSLPQDYWILLVSAAHAHEKLDRARVRRLRRTRRRGWLRERARRAASTRWHVRAPRDLAALPANDLASSPARARQLVALGAFRADVTGRWPDGLCHSFCTANKRAQRRRKSLAKGVPGSRHQRGTVDHMAYSQPMIEAGGTRIGRWLRGRRVRLALWVAVDRRRFSLRSTPDLTKWTVLVIGAILLAFYMVAGRNMSWDVGRQLSWIALASQALRRSSL